MYGVQCNAHRSPLLTLCAPIDKARCRRGCKWKGGPHHLLAARPWSTSSKASSSSSSSSSSTGLHTTRSPPHHPRPAHRDRSRPASPHASPLGRDRGRVTHHRPCAPPHPHPHPYPPYWPRSHPHSPSASRTSPHRRPSPVTRIGRPVRPALHVLLFSSACFQPRGGSTVWRLFEIFAEDFPEN